MKLLIFVQARLGSTRLPGKVLKPLAGKPQLQHLFDRLGKFTGGGNLVVVTSDLPIDDAIESYCAEQEVGCFRGSEEDVLDRFYRAALAHNATPETVIVRVTADCPLHHEEVVRFAIDQFERHELDYFSNSFAPFYEDGCDTEVFRFSALQQAHQLANLASQREHVTPFIKDSGLFLCGYKKFNADYKFKLSVDTLEDHTTVESIFHALAPSYDFSINTIVDLLRSNPQILEANKNSVINAGYAKSLANDKEVK